MFWQETFCSTQSIISLPLLLIAFVIVFKYLLWEKPFHVFYGSLSLWINYNFLLIQRQIISWKLEKENSEEKETQKSLITNFNSTYSSKVILTRFLKLMLFQYTMYCWRYKTKTPHIKMILVITFLIFKITYAVFFLNYMIKK